MPDDTPQGPPLIKHSTLQEVADILKRVHQHERVLPAAAWLLNPLWLLAGWSATTFRWHPTGDAPPVMGFVFEVAKTAQRLFQDWTDRWGSADELEEIRISIIEGDIPGQDAGYSVHICPHPENCLVRATAEGVVIKDIPLGLLGQVRRMHPIAGTPPLLPRFKQEFQKLQEFLLAPVTRRDDGQLWVDVELGIVKRALHFRQTADIKEGDIDEVVLRAPRVLPEAAGSH